LRRVEESKNLRQAYFLIGLTVLIIGSLVIFGLPLMIKATNLWSDLKAGNEITANKDKIAPQTPILEAYPQHTKESSLELNGKTEPGVVVSARVNSFPTKEVITDSEGKFTLFVDLDEGINSIAITAQDPAGNESQPKQITIEYDNQPPELILTNPTETTSTTEENRLTISGTTEPLAYVYLNERRLVVNPNGGFSTSVSLTEGENIFLIKAQDKAENETEIEVKVTYSRF